MKPILYVDGYNVIGAWAQAERENWPLDESRDRLNLQNENPTTVQIAYETLSQICHSVGVIQCQDSQQLHNIPLLVKVKLRPAGPGR